MKPFCLPILLLSLSGVLLAGCDNKQSSTQGGNPLTAPVDYLDASAKAKISAEKTVDVVSVNQAIQMFGADEGRYPADLNELVTKGYLRKIPEPPFGTQLVYDAAKGEVKVVKK